MSKRTNSQGVFMDSLVVAFDVNGEELRLHLDTSELPGNTFATQNGPQTFKFKGVSGHSFGGLEEFANPDAYTDIFIPIWGTAHDIHFDIEVNLVKDGPTYVLQESSIKAANLSLLLDGTVVPLEDYDQEILEPFKEGRVLDGVIKTVVKGSRK